MEINNNDEFIKEVNNELGGIFGVLEIKENKQMFHPHFELCLRRNKYAMRDQVVLKTGGAFSEMIEKVSKKYFQTNPRFNNTGRSFWFI